MHMMKGQSCKSNHSDLLGASNLDFNVRPINHFPDLEGPPVNRADPFCDFEFTSPPTAELEVLRVLEAHICRKKKD